MTDTTLAIVPATLALTPQYIANVANLHGQSGYGIFNWQGHLYSIWLDTGGTTASLYKDGTKISTPMDASFGVYTFDSVLGATPVLFMQNSKYAYAWDETHFTAMAIQDFGSGTAYFANNSTAITIVDLPVMTGYPAGRPVDSGWIGATITAAGIPAGAFVESVGSNLLNINFPTTSEVLAATPTAFDVVFGGIPADLVKGSAYLDGTLYVMRRPQAAIRGCDFNAPYNWPPSNSILAQVEQDEGVRLAKQLVYVIAFGQWSTEVFYDAGNPAGSPLAPVQGAKINVGCRHADTVREMEGRLFWVGQTRSGSTEVYMMDGLKAAAISTPQIERLLEDADWGGKIYSWTAICAGHKYYAITVVNSNITLVYDASTGFWAQWTDTNGNYYPMVDCTWSNINQPLLQHESNGRIYVLDQNVYTDDGDMITFDLVTPNFDGGTRKRKYAHSMDFVADQTAGSLLQVRCTDNDYQNWTNFREVDLGKERPRLTGLGTFRRRAYHFRHAKQVPLRILAIEMQIDIGEL